MVKTSLIRLINYRTRDIHWWNCGKKWWLKSANAELLKLKKEDDLKADIYDSSSMMQNLINNLKSIETDSTKVLNLINDLERFYSLKYDQETSRRLLKEQLNLFQNQLQTNSILKNTFKDAITKWESKMKN